MTPQEIKDILSKSGYLFEQQIASVIEQAGYATMTNSAYLDDQENKSREIDIVAHKLAFKIERDIPIKGVIYLNCECKNSSNPFVFINRKKGFFDNLYTPDGLVFLSNSYTLREGIKAPVRLDAFHYMGLDKYHYASKSEYKAAQICKIIQNGNKKEAQHTGIIESFIYPLIKSMRVWKKNSPDNTYEERYCKFFYNLAIVNSKLYTINSEEENAMPVEVKFVPFIREVQTQDIKGTFLITFINSDYISTFETRSGNVL